MDQAQLDGVTNWGRWGSEDEQGSLNLITPEIIKKAAGLVKTGKTYSLSVPLETEGPQWPSRQKIWKVMMHSTNQTGAGFSGDAVTMHSHSGTHIDALCHFWYDNQMYNGRAASEHASFEGSTSNAIHNVSSIVGRGVLLDVAGWKGIDHLAAGEPVSANDLDQCVAAQNITLQSGDIVLVRTGWMSLFITDRAMFDSGEPGIDESTLPWLKEHEVVGIGADNHGVEVMKSIPPDRLPIHEFAIRDLGVYLLENLDLDALATDKVYECLLVIAPLRLTGGAGSPINPIAIA